MFDKGLRSTIIDGVWSRNERYPAYEVMIYRTASKKTVRKKILVSLLSIGFLNSDFTMKILVWDVYANIDKAYPYKVAIVILDQQKFSFSKFYFINFGV